MMSLSGRCVSAAVLMILTASSAFADPETISVTKLETILKENPLPPGPAASIVGSLRAGEASLGVLVMRENRLHHHVAQDHVLYLVRGTGIARLESANGAIETRSIGPGDILTLPRGRKHGFKKSSDEDLVFLVVANPVPSGVEETTCDE
jgi:oxalate decarboxylase/phosphoglucose isomerase-like protein (cupin superfamily)